MICRSFFTMSNQQQQKEWASFLLSKKILLDESLLALLDQLPSTFDLSSFFKEVQNQHPHKEITKTIFVEALQKNPTPNTTQPQEEKGPVEVIFSYDKESKKRKVKDFVSYFNKRYQAIKKILQNRQELEHLTSISRLQGNAPPGPASVIGLISEKRETANGNILLCLEDPTGEINVLVNKNKADLLQIAKHCVLDEVVGIVGNTGDNIIFANNLLLPDIPVNKELKKAPEEVYAIFLSDIHVGSKQFMPDEFEKFFKWLNGKTGNARQRSIAQKVKYILIVGDVVDGVGVYPSQKNELIIEDIREQYDVLTDYLRRIPPHIQIILSPGNHDAVRIEEPQPKLGKEYAGALYDLPNVHLVSNPALVNIHKTKGFPGFDILLYHGYSYDYYIANIDYIRENGGYDRADLVMKFLLQRRHLSPTHTATVYLPDDEEDPLIINHVPDIFASGHLHKAAIANYRNVTLICSSCWQDKTPFQEKMGHHPEPARVPVINLQTREFMLLNFEKTKEEPQPATTQQESNQKQTSPEPPKTTLPFAEKEKTAPTVFS